MPARRTEDTGNVRLGSKALNVVMFTMAPPPWRSITGVTRRAMRTTLRTTRSSPRRQSSSEISRRSPLGGPPVWFTTASMRP
jgi:hypothetical protein